MKCLYEEETDMRYTLENENLKVEIDSFGAEIKSVKRKSDNFEYMWLGAKILLLNVKGLILCQKEK